MRGIGGPATVAVELRPRDSEFRNRKTVTMRRTSLQRRLRRLEESRSKRPSTFLREAFIGIADDSSGEYHLEFLSKTCERRSYFKEMPGPGLQLADFGEFDRSTRCCI